MPSLGRPYNADLKKIARSDMYKGTGLARAASEAFEKRRAETPKASKAEQENMKRREQPWQQDEPKPPRHRMSEKIRTATYEIPERDQPKRIRTTLDMLPELNPPGDAPMIDPVTGKGNRLRFDKRLGFNKGGAVRDYAKKC